MRCLLLQGTSWLLQGATIKVKEVDTGVEHDVDECKWVKFSGLDWRADSQGFFYSRYAADDAIHDAGAETTSAATPGLQDRSQTGSVPSKTTISPSDAGRTSRWSTPSNGVAASSR